MPRTFTKRLYALDTNVLLRDPDAIISFQEHDVLLVDGVLEELDHGKKGDHSQQLTARFLGRSLRQMSEKYKENGGDPKEGIPLEFFSETSKATGRLFYEKSEKPADFRLYRGQNNDTIILQSVLNAKRDPRFRDHRITFVTKDNLAAVKCDRFGLPCEDFTTDQVAEDFDPKSAVHCFGPEYWESPEYLHAVSVCGAALRDPESLLQICCTKPCLPNELVLVSHPEKPPFEGITRGWKDGVLTFSPLCDYKATAKVFGLHARNTQQNFALNCLMDPKIRIVILTGDAGTGKTLLALAAGLQQTVVDERYEDVTCMRPFNPFGDDIGALPGDKDEKTSDWMMPYRDNLRVLLPGGSTVHGVCQPALAEKAILSDFISFEPLTFMKGRTLHDSFVILDEMQDREPRVLEGLLNRAGETSKVIVLGNNSQIDSHTLTARTTSLAFAADRLRGHPIVAVVHLDVVERSHIASVVVELFKRKKD